ncbi:MAG: DNA mismatch repair protein MutS, partial [Candidatus Omnitrophota bacterium]
GGTDDSYGIYVAKLAGIPKEVVQRSKQILTQLELHGNLKEKIRARPPGSIQLSLFSDSCGQLTRDIKEEIESLEINALTPLEAINKIQEWKKKLSD